MEQGDKKFPRQPNQYRMITSPDQLTEGAEKLLELIKKYEFHDGITNTQWGYLMGISRRMVIHYINELEKKGKIKVHPQNRRHKPGEPNKYEIL